MDKQNKKEKRKEIKILLLGDSGVGKTSIFHRYCKKQFEENKTATVGADILTKEITYKNESYKIHILDTAGQERFRSITSSYFHMSDYYFVVFDLTNKNSLDSIPDWLQQLKKEKENPKYIILGNKDDLKKNQIPNEEINKTLDNLGTIKINKENFLRVSAKSGKNIDEAFNFMIDVFNNNVNINENKEDNITAKLDKENIQKTNTKMKCC